MHIQRSEVFRQGVAVKHVLLSKELTLLNDGRRTRLSPRPGNTAGGHRSGPDVNLWCLDEQDSDPKIEDVYDLTTAICTIKTKYNLTCFTIELT